MREGGKVEEEEGTRGKERRERMKRRGHKRRK